jgi:hypothetical protein
MVNHIRSFSSLCSRFRPGKRVQCFRGGKACEPKSVRLKWAGGCPSMLQLLQDALAQLAMAKHVRRSIDPGHGLPPVRACGSSVFNVGLMSSAAGGFFHKCPTVIVFVLDNE